MKGDRSKTFLITISAIVILLIYLFPIIWMTATSFRFDQDAWSYPPKVFSKFTLSQYINLFKTRPIGMYFRNSFSVATISVLFSMALGIPAAFALARFKIQRKKDISFWLLSQLMLPPIAAVVPYYLFMKQLGLLQTRTSLILVYSTFNIPFIIWMMTTFFEGLPREIEEAALIDGCSIGKLFWKIVIPLSVNGIASAVLFCVITSWNEFLYALTLAGLDSYTLPVSVMTFWTDKHVYWGQILAIGILQATPIVILGILIQKFIISGLTLGAVKE
jgi:multiple sugar transport system permease protein